MAEIDDLFACAVCLDWFKSPRRLPCHHVYCLECLSGLVKPEAAFITCPECRCDHVVPNNGAESFPVDGRLEQIIEKQKYGSRRICKEYSRRSKCDNCQLPTCRGCETNHRALLLESLLQDLRQFEIDFYAENQILERKEQMNGLLQYKITLGTFRVRIDQGIDEIMKEIESCRVALLSRIEEEETLVLLNISNLNQAEKIDDEHQTLKENFVDKVHSTETLVTLTEQIDKEKQLLSSLPNIKQNNFKRIHFDVRNLKNAISNYGNLVTDLVDYESEFRLLTTLDGTESGCLFNGPFGLTVCPFTDNVYVTDSTSICVYNSDGEFLRHIVTNGEQACGVVIDGNQRVIVTSCNKTNVNIYSHDLQLIKSFGSKGVQHGQFNHPYGVACDVDNNIYVADRDNKRIQVFTPDGTFLREIGRGILQLPWSIQINQRHQLIVTDYKVNKVFIFSRDGQHLKTLPGEGDNNTFCRPIGICLDTVGHLLVADSGNKVIDVYTDDGTHYCTIDEPAVAMNNMFALAVTSSGVIFITDNGGNKLHLIAATK